MSDMPLPPGTRLLHIGPHKTGTTALQIALGKNREALLEQGVRYIWCGDHLNANFAALALAGRSTRRSASAMPVPIKHWRSVVQKVAAASETERIIISGEEFCSLSERTIQKALSELDERRAHVLITLRPLEKIIVSQWQQYVQSGAVTKPVSEWARAVLNREISVEKVQGFWERHDHGALVERWSNIAGRDKVTVVVLDENDRTFLFRTFEKLIGLTPGTISADDRLVNRSLTWEEAEAMRSMYALLREKNLDDFSDHLRFMISPSESIKRERRPSKKEIRIVLESSELVKARAIGRASAERIRASGVRVIGGLEHLNGSQNLATELSSPQPHMIPVDLAGWVAFGVIDRSGISRGNLPPVPSVTLPAAWLGRATGSQLVREVIRRIKLRLANPRIHSTTGEEKRRAE